MPHAGSIFRAQQAALHKRVVSIQSLHAYRLCLDATEARQRDKLGVFVCEMHLGAAQG